VYNSLIIAVFGAEFLKIYSHTVRAYLCRYYAAACFTNRLCYA
jgi:hypothetical protein